MENNVELIAKDLKLSSEAMAAGASMPAMNDASAEIDLVMRQSLKTGSELMASCAALASGPHELAVNVLIRSLIELGLKANWATLSTENAKHLLASSKEQVKTIFMANAKTGIARIVDNEGNDLTAEFIASGRAERGQKQFSVETMAKQSGLHDIYNIFYRFQSMHTHGNETADASLATKPATLCCVGAFSMFLGHVGVRWLVARCRLDNEEIRDLLGLNARVQP